MTPQLKKNMLWNTVGNLVYLISQWLITVLVTNFFGYTDAGILSLAMSISATFQTLSLFGIRNFQVSDVKQKYSDNCYIGLRNITCVVAFILCILFSVINGYNFKTIIAIILFMIFRLAENYSDVLHGFFQKNDRLYIAGQSLFIKGILIFTAFICGCLLFNSLNIGILFMTIVSVSETILFDVIIARRMGATRFYDSWVNCAVLAKETFPLCLYMFLNSIIATAPKYILEKMCTEELLGAYSSIFAPALLIQAAANYIYMPFVSQFAKMYNKKNIKGFYNLSLKIMSIIVIAGLVILILAFFLGDWGLTLLFGESILEYSNLLILILVGTFSTAINAFFQMLATTVRALKDTVISSIIGAALSSFFSFVMIGFISADGASVGLIIGTLSSALYLILKIKRKLTEARRNEQ